MFGSFTAFGALIVGLVVGCGGEAPVAGDDANVTDQATARKTAGDNITHGISGCWETTKAKGTGTRKSVKKAKQVCVADTLTADGGVSRSGRFVFSFLDADGERVSPDAGFEASVAQPKCVGCYALDGFDGNVVWSGGFPGTPVKLGIAFRTQEKATFELSGRIDTPDEGGTTDAEIQAAIEDAARDALYVSESDYPFTYVSAEGATGAITEELVRDAFAAVVDGDPDADKPMADLVSMTSEFAEWVDNYETCEDDGWPESCSKPRALMRALQNHLEDVHVFYFGADGEPGNVEGVAVSIFIVGRTPAGTLAGVRTLAIWT